MKYKIFQICDTVPTNDILLNDVRSGIFSFDNKEDAIKFGFKNINPIFEWIILEVYQNHKEKV